MQSKFLDSPKFKVLKDFESLKNQSRTKELLPTLSLEVLEKLAALCPAPSQEQKTIEHLHNTLLEKMPKTDIHVHGDTGFLDVETARILAKRNNCDFPEHLIDKENNIWKYRGKDDFMQFIIDFLTLSALIQTPQDIEDIAYAFYKYCYENNVIFSLPGISWVQCMNNMSFPEFNEAYNRALLRGMNDFGSISILRLRYYQERHVDKELFNKTWEQLAANPNPLITTIGLAGKEEGFPLEDFKEFYLTIKKLRQESGKPWYFLTAHMEAFSNAKTIREALNYLDWIAHGRHAAQDLDFVEELSSQKIRFELCPLSDTSVYPSEIPSLKDHNELRILAEKKLISLNSDDPAFFQGIHVVYKKVFHELPATYSDLLQCTLNGLCSASPQALKEMEQFQKQQYMDHDKIVDLGLFKIMFFQYYWRLLPLIVNIEAEFAQKLFAIELKTDMHTLLALSKESADIYPEIQQQLQLLISTKQHIESYYKEVLAKTEELVKEFSHLSTAVEENRFTNVF
jgi:adenosine deaminase